MRYPRLWYLDCRVETWTRPACLVLKAPFKLPLGMFEVTLFWYQTWWVSVIEFWFKMGLTVVAGVVFIGLFLSPSYPTLTTFTSFSRVKKCDSTPPGGTCPTCWQLGTLLLILFWQFNNSIYWDQSRLAHSWKSTILQQHIPRWFRRNKRPPFFDKLLTKKPIVIKRHIHRRFWSFQ